MIPIITVEEVEKVIRERLHHRKGYSLIRIGDDELTTLAHDIILSSEQIKEDPHLNFLLQFTGFHVPDHPSRNLLAENVKGADLIGIPTKRLPTFQSMFIKLSKYYNWPLKKMSFTHSSINYSLNETPLYNYLLSNYRVLLIGNRMQEGSELLKSRGYGNITGIIPVNGLHDIKKVLDETTKYTFDVALVSA